MKSPPNPMPNFTYKINRLTSKKPIVESIFSEFSSLKIKSTLKPLNNDPWDDAPVDDSSIIEYMNN